jgi:hypothetical protein
MKYFELNIVQKIKYTGHNTNIQVLIDSFNQIKEIIVSENFVENLLPYFLNYVDYRSNC